MLFTADAKIPWGEVPGKNLDRKKLIKGYNNSLYTESWKLEDYQGSKRS